MQMRAVQLFVAIGGLLTWSCARPASTDTHAAEADIRLLDDQWSAAAGKGDLNAAVAFYSEDAVLLPPNQSLASGKNAIRASWEGLLKQTAALSWKASNVEVAKSGELGYLYGTFRLTVKDAAGAPGAVDTGKMVEI